MALKNNYPVINKTPSNKCRVLTLKYLNEQYSCNIVAVKNMKFGRLGHASIFKNNKVYVLAGVGAEEYLKSCEVYDLEN